MQRVRAGLRLLRPKQWSKSVFCLIGPAYGFELARSGHSLLEVLLPVLAAAASFALASSACYVINDLADAEADRMHPRKKHRPIASGLIKPAHAKMLFVLCLIGSLSVSMLIPAPARWWALVSVVVYVANVLSYSAVLKHIAIADVMSLAMGFVLRVMGGCAAVALVPSVWLLNVTFFLSMFLAFGKRLGERRAFGDGDEAAKHRPVQGQYSDVILQMAVVVTAVVTLVTYAFYLQSKEGAVVVGFSLLWLTILPATFALLRAIVLVERGRYDDPTELAYKDRPFQVAGILFVVITVGVALIGKGLTTTPA